jgi:hypothetical protein
MSLSTAGLIGAGAGLAMALVIYLVMSTVWRRNLQDVNAPAEQRERFERMWPAVRIMLIVDFVILGWLGYTAGEILGS